MSSNTAWIDDMQHYTGDVTGASKILRHSNFVARVRGIKSISHADKMIWSWQIEAYGKYASGHDVNYSMQDAMNRAIATMAKYVLQNMRVAKPDVFFGNAGNTGNIHIQTGNTTGGSGSICLSSKKQP